MKNLRLREIGSLCDPIKKLWLRAHSCNSYQETYYLYRDECLRLKVKDINEVQTETKLINAS